MKTDCKAINIYPEPNYKDLIPFLLRWEGGEVNDPNDKGGHTNKGVTYGTYEQLCKGIYGVNPSKAHFISLTDNEVGLIVKHFWDKSTNNNQIRCQKVAEAITTWRWGSGTQGLMWFQMMLNQSFSGKLSIDGVIGKGTIDLINSQNQDLLFKSALEYRAERFNLICKFNTSQEIYLRGWLNRLTDFGKRWNETI